MYEDGAGARPLLATVRQATGEAYDVQHVTYEVLCTAPWESSTRMVVLGSDHAAWDTTDARRPVLARLRAFVEQGGVVAALGYVPNSLPGLVARDSINPAGRGDLSADAAAVPVGHGHVLCVADAAPSASALVPWFRAVHVLGSAQDAPAPQLSPLYATALAAPLLDAWLSSLLAHSDRTKSPVWVHEVSPPLAVWEAVPPWPDLETWDVEGALALVAVRPSAWAAKIPPTPYFDANAYFDALSVSRAQSSTLPWPSPRSFHVSAGQLIVYGAVVSSTQTLLEQHRPLLRTCPPGTTVIATHQVRGRGRAQNAWLSPLGALPFSTMVHLPLHIGNKAVFLQYLAALAIVYGLESAYPALQGFLRIKWPNDIYANVPQAQPGSVCMPVDGVEHHFVKIGGILVTAVCEDDTLHAIVGCGINCLNDEPTTSVRQLAAHGGVAHVSLETCAGAILAALESLLRVWTDHAYSFAPFVPAYRRAWLHSDQVVTLAHMPGEPRRLVGVTCEHGLLRTVPVHSDVRAADTHAWLAGTVPDAVDVQPDGNSFDLFAGCVRPK